MSPHRRLADDQRFVDASIVGWVNYLHGNRKAANALMLKENRRQVARLRAGDVLIEPPLGPLSSADFVAGMNEGIALGEQATVAMLPQLRAYQVSPEAYAAWRAARAAKLQPASLMPGGGTRPGMLGSRSPFFARRGEELRRPCV